MDPELARREGALVDRLTTHFVRSGLDSVRARQAAVELVDDPETIAQLGRELFELAQRTDLSYPVEVLVHQASERAQHDGADDDGRADALHIHGKLGEELETLRLLERKLKRRRDQDLKERVRADMVAVAIEHVESAIAALLRAGKK